MANKLDEKIRVTKIPKLKKDAVLVLANKLGYTIKIIGNNQIYLVKDDVWLRRKSYIQAYQYLYTKDYRIKKKEIENDSVD